MAVRILTGIITPDQNEGTVTIQFNPHSVTGEGKGARLKAAGEQGEFARPPAVSLSVREFCAPTLRPDFRDLAWDFKLNDRDLTKSSVVVGWFSDGERPTLKEISYIIVGDV